MAEKKIIVSYSGEADENLLIFLLKKVENSPAVPKKIKKNVCLATLELINNIIEHHSKSAECKYELSQSPLEIILKTENFSRPTSVNFVQRRIDLIRAQKSTEEFYFSLLHNTKPGVSRMLGLVRIFRKCEGKINVGTDKSGKKIVFTLKFTKNA
jgi:hypothetical protein